MQVKECGFTLEEIRTLFPIEKAKEVNEEAIDVLDKKIADIDDRLFKLERMKELLHEIKGEIIEPKCTEMQKITGDFFKLQR